jgi:hypothetical protein
MALINCPECSKEVSDKAPACPSCGVPLNKLADIHATCEQVSEKTKEGLSSFWQKVDLRHKTLIGFALTGCVILVIVPILSSQPSWGVNFGSQWFLDRYGTTPGMASLLPHGGGGSVLGLLGDSKYGFLLGIWSDFGLHYGGPNLGYPEEPDGVLHELFGGPNLIYVRYWITFIALFGLNFLVWKFIYLKIKNRPTPNV